MQLKASCTSMQLKAACTRKHLNRHSHAGCAGVDTYEVAYVAHDVAYASHAGSAGKHRAGAVAGVGVDREDSSEPTTAQFWREPSPRETSARNIAAAAPPPPLLLRVRPGGCRAARARRAHAAAGTLRMLPRTLRMLPHTLRMLPVEGAVPPALVALTAAGV